MEDRKNARIPINGDLILKDIHESGHSIQSLAEKIGISESTILHYLHKGEIPLHIMRKIDNVVFWPRRIRMVNIVRYAMIIQEHLDLFEQLEDDESDTPDNLDQQLQKITESQIVVAASKSLGDELGRDAGEIMEELGQVAFERYKNAKEYCDSHSIDDNLKKWNEGYREAITREEYEYSRSD